MIVDAEARNRMHRLCYEFCSNGIKHQIWGPWQEQWNPMDQIFTKFRVGQVVALRIQERNMRVIESPWRSVVYIALALLLLFIGFLLIMVGP